MIKYIKYMFDNYLIKKSYKKMIDDIDSEQYNQLQMDILFSNSGIDL